MFTCQSFDVNEGLSFETTDFPILDSLKQRGHIKDFCEAFESRI